MHWLLRCLEQNPRTLHRGRDLRLRDPAAFDALRAERLLRRIPREGERHLPYGARLLTIDEQPDGSLEAFDEDDPDFVPVAVTFDDVSEWRLDLDAVAAAVRTRNGLAGEPALLDERLLYLGQAAGRIGVVLLLTPGAALPALDENACRGFLVLTVTLVPIGDWVRELSRRHVRFARLSPAFPLVLDRAALETLHLLRTAGLPADFIDEGPLFGAGPGFRSVRWHGRTAPYTFTTQQAQVVEYLYFAWKNGTPDVAQTTLLERLGTPTDRLRDTFRGSDAWHTLVVEGKSSRTVRLELPLPR